MTPDLAPAAVCDYCELPLPESWWGESGRRGRPRTSHAIAAWDAGSPRRSSTKRARMVSREPCSTRLGLSVFFTMNVIAFTMALWTTDVYGTSESAGNLAPVLNGLFRYLTLIFSVPVLLLLGLPLFEHAWNGLRRGILSTEWLLASGVAAAFAISFLSVFRGRGGGLLRSRLRDPGHDDAGPLARSDRQTQGQRGARCAHQTAARPGEANPRRAGADGSQRARSRSTTGCGFCPASGFPSTAGSSAIAGWSKSRC